jgi:hypothetical protein
MSKHEEANLILKLYELRREPTMRTARDWYFMEFNPESMADYNAALFSENSGHVRMVVSYWDMAAALVNSGAIGLDLFTETNGEHFGVFAKVELLLGEMRAAYGPQVLMNLEKLIDATPGGRERCAIVRTRTKEIRAMVSAQRAASAAGA